MIIIISQKESQSFLKALYEQKIMSIFQFQSSDQAIFIEALSQINIKYQKPPMESAVRQIHSRLIGLMQKDDLASSSIMKKYLRYYTENELERQHLPKELCTSKDLQILTKKISERFGNKFGSNGRYFKRFSKHFIFGVNLPRELAAQEARFKATLMQRQKSNAGNSNLAPSRVINKPKIEHQIMYEEPDRDQDESLLEESRVKNTNHNIVNSRVRTGNDIGNRLREAFRGSMARPSSVQSMERKIRELEEDNKHLEAVVNYLMKQVVDLTESERKYNISADEDQSNTNSRLNRQLRNLM